jgi:hypothetical protein
VFGCPRVGDASAKYSDKLFRGCFRSTVRNKFILCASPDPILHTSLFSFILYCMASSGIITWINPHYVFITPDDGSREYVIADFEECPDMKGAQTGEVVTYDTMGDERRWCIYARNVTRTAVPLQPEDRPLPKQPRLTLVGQRPTQRQQQQRQQFRQQQQQQNTHSQHQWSK